MGTLRTAARVRVFGLALCAACLVASLTACEKDAEPPNVALISLDTLRAVTMGAYGYSRDTSPFFDALAKEGFLFENAITTSTTTAPAHMSIFSGLYPRNHGVRTGFEPRVGRPATLARSLKKIGYATAAFTESGFLSFGQRFKEGFDSYRQTETERERRAAGFSAETFAAAQAWLRAQREEPFFLFVHTYEVHYPYAPAEPYAEMFQDAAAQPESPLDAQRDLYDREVRYLDDRLAELVGTIRGHESDRPTVLIILSDHGEEFGEHGEFQHSSNLYDEVLRVPLLVWAPGLIRPGRSERQVSLVDIAPTVLDLAGAPTPPDLDGVSLVPTLLRGEPPPDRVLFAEAAARRKWIGVWQSEPAHPYRVAIRSQDRKVIVHRPEGEQRDPVVAYDLRADPEEKHPIELTDEARAEAEKLADRYLSESEPISASESVVDTLDPAMRERMRLLGYVDQSSADAGSGPSIRPSK